MFLKIYLIKAQPQLKINIILGEIPKVINM